MTADVQAVLDGTAQWALIEGDCLGPAGLATLPDKSVDHVITDPPYEAEAHTLGRRIHNPRTKEIREAPLDFDAITPETRDTASLHIARIARRWQLVFSQVEATSTWSACLRGHGSRYIRTMVWTKPNGQPQLTGDRPGMGYEMIVVCHGPEVRLSWNAGGKRGVYVFSVDANFSRTPRYHSTQKPLDLMEQLVRDFTDPGELVIDPFAGSGTTGVACLRMGRRFIGWERDPKYAAIARGRLSTAREQLDFLNFSTAQEIAK